MINYGGVLFTTGLNFGVWKGWMLNIGRGAFFARRFGSLAREFATTGGLIFSGVWTPLPSPPPESMILVDYLEISCWSLETVGKFDLLVAFFSRFGAYGEISFVFRFKEHSRLRMVSLWLVFSNILAVVGICGLKTRW